MTKPDAAHDEPPREHAALEAASEKAPSAGQRPPPPPQPEIPPTPSLFEPAPPLASSRYNRQLLLPQLSLAGQERLLASRVLIVGLGGLGSPAALYLAGAGIGTLGLLDADTVEPGNLHRQIAHTESSVADTKVTSALRACTALNSEIRYVAHEEALVASNALAIVSRYDVVLDCTDNPATRYLISDVCVVLGRVLVSGAAQRGEGQVVVLNCPAGGGERGPWYRCVFPRPPAPELVRGCAEIGVLGTVVGVIGTLMAGEAIKLIARGEHLCGDQEGYQNGYENGYGNERERESGQTHPPPAGHADSTSTSTSISIPTSTSTSTATQRQAQTQTTATTPQKKHHLLLHNTFASDPRHVFRTITLRGRRPDCIACGDDDALRAKGLVRITRAAIEGSTNSDGDAEGGQGTGTALDYIAWCGVQEDVKLLPDEQRASAAEFLRTLDGRPEGSHGSLTAHDAAPPLVVDVREAHEVLLGPKIRGSVNIPLSKIVRRADTAFAALEGSLDGGGDSRSNLRGLKDPSAPAETGLSAATATALDTADIPNPADTVDTVDPGHDRGGVGGRPVYFVCQRGNDSQIAAKKLMEHLGTSSSGTRAGARWIGDVKGGFVAMEAYTNPNPTASP